MSETFGNEIPGLVESLTPHQRQALQRVLGECLDELAALPDQPHRERLQRMLTSLRPIHELLDALRGSSLAAEDDSDIRPFSVGFPETGHAVVRLSRKILSWSQIWEERAHSWMADARVATLTVDVSRLDELNSSTIAWLVTLAQKVPGGHLTLVGPNTAMRRSLKVLHLEKVLVTGD